MGQESFVEVENTSVSPGGVTKVTASAVNITEAKMGPPSFEWKIKYEKIRPSPQITWQSRPPLWQWKSPQPTVTIEAILYAPEDPSREKYYCSVRVRDTGDDNDGEWITGAGIIALIESSNGQ